MKIEIDKNGYLHIERAGRMKKQSCPCRSGKLGEFMECGDWCPLFSEPFYTDENRIVHIGLCHRTKISCKTADFTDERKG
jgi:hypothetical protein